MTVAHDLAALVEYARLGAGPVDRRQREVTVALDRVEAEIARLEQVVKQSDDVLALYQDRDGDGKTGWQERAEAAEAEVARLRDGLEHIEQTCAGVVQRIAEVGEPPAHWSGTQIDAERMRDFARALRRIEGFQNPTERAEAMTTPEDRRGWDQPRHPEPMGEGSPHQETGTGAATGGVRAEAHRAEGRAGGDPGSVPAAVRGGPDTGSLAALLAQATPGPWHANTGGSFYAAELRAPSPHNGFALIKVMTNADADLALIALAPDMARLLDHVYGKYAHQFDDETLARFAALDEKAGAS